MIDTDAAEGRTLAIPGEVGQMLCLVMDDDGGHCTIDVAAAINQASN